ncbi:hypothetical protein T492DRAFT_844508 [Pavlovales sp. CCMP2436]|nr:hypothetical protein T492DRAFT_844508 [Pavlovales sp. CCMP2436]
MAAPPHVALGALLRALLCVALAAAADESLDCDSWAGAGECTGNPGFMLRACATACAAAKRREPTGGGKASEVEQCGGWADSGECVRNPQYMLHACPSSCLQQRASASESLLDDDDDCATWADQGGCARTKIQQARVGGESGSRESGGESGRAARELQKRSRCLGACAAAELCRAHSGPVSAAPVSAAPVSATSVSDGGASAESLGVCLAALRCQELLDRDGCELLRSGAEGRMLARCFLSCARHDISAVLALYEDSGQVNVNTYIMQWTVLGLYEDRC